MAPKDLKAALTASLQAEHQAVQARGRVYDRCG